MCPSYRATGEEKHSTRGRARLLFEIASGRAVVRRRRADEVRDALDLCLSCKGCKRDCPVGVDMATYKSEFLRPALRGPAAAGDALFAGLAAALAPAGGPDPERGGC